MRKSGFAAAAGLGSLALLLTACGGSSGSPSLMVVTARQSCFSVHGIFTDPVTDSPATQTIQRSSARPSSRPLATSAPREVAMVKTVTKVTGIPINHYARIDFSHITNLVNAIGGLDVTIPTATLCA